MFSADFAQTRFLAVAYVKEEEFWCLRMASGKTARCSSYLGDGVQV